MKKIHTAALIAASTAFLGLGIASAVAQNVSGADPYQRKTITFDAALDRASGTQLAKVKEIGVDTTPYRVEYDPGHPAADKAGYDQARTAVTKSIDNDVASVFIDAVRQRAKPQINQQAFDSVVQPQ